MASLLSLTIPRRRLVPLRRFEIILLGNVFVLVRISLFLSIMALNIIARYLELLDGYISLNKIAICYFFGITVLGIEWVIITFASNVERIDSGDRAYAGADQIQVKSHPRVKSDHDSPTKLLYPIRHSPRLRKSKIVAVQESHFERREAK